MDLYKSIYRSVPGSAVLHSQALMHTSDSPILSTAVEMMMNQSADLDNILNTMKKMDNGTLQEFPLGDVRYLNQDGTSTSTATAFLHVDNPDGSVYIHLNFIDSGETEPILGQEDFNEWKACGGKITGSLTQQFMRILCNLL